MEIIRKNSEERDSNILGQLASRYLPYWPVFILLIFLFLAGAWVYLRFATPVYEINAKIVIKDEKKGTEDAKTLEELNLITPKKIVENEMEVLHSSKIITEAARELYLYAPIYQENRFGKKAAFYTSPIVIQAKDPENLKSAEKVAFKYDYAQTAVALNGKKYALNTWQNTPFGILQFTPNPDFDNSTKETDFFFSLMSLKAAATSVGSRLKVAAPNKQSTIIDLSFTDEIPARGEKILNKLIDAYSDALVSETNDLAEHTLAFIDERLNTVKHDLDSIESRLQQFRAQTGAVDIGAQGRMYLDNVGQNDQKLGEMNMQLSMLGQVKDYVQSKESSGRMVPSTMGINDPVLSGLVTNLYKAEVEYEALKTTSGENNPTTLAAKEELDKMRPGVLENIRSQERSLNASRSSMSTTNSGYSSVLRTIPATERTFLEITREREITSKTYNFLQQKKEETTLSQISNQANSRVIDRAEASQSPVSPKKKLVYFASALVAIIAGVGFVFGKEKIGNKIMFRQDIESLTELPIIAEISSEGSKNPIVIDDRKKTLIAEQFRKLRISLNYLGVNTKHKRILVTSSISGEGKSFVATNLAISLAITGKKVVLIDFDLNNPTLNDKLNVKEQKGVTEYLQDEATADEIIRQTDLHENLSLISTGKLPFNPSELIMSENVEKLLTYLNDRFDYIVMDTAPVAPVTDAYLLSKYCDATLYIVRHNYSPKMLVELIDSNNRMNNLKNAAIVFNGVKPRGFGKQNYGYGYTYGNTYPYGYGNQKQLK